MVNPVGKLRPWLAIVVRIPVPAFTLIKRRGQAPWTMPARWC